MAYKFKPLPIFGITSYRSASMYRYNVNSSKAWTLISVVFAVTIVLSYLFPGYPILITGFLLAIFLTMFIPGKKVTYIAAIAAAAIRLALFFFKEQDNGSTHSIGQITFQLVLVVFVALATLYLKDLYKN